MAAHGDNWPHVEWTPDGWWGDVPEWPEERETLPEPRVGAAAMLFCAATVVLIGVIVGYQLYALAKGWVR